MALEEPNQIDLADEYMKRIYDAEIAFREAYLEASNCENDTPEEAVARVNKADQRQIEILAQLLGEVPHLKEVIIELFTEIKSVPLSTNDHRIIGPFEEVTGEHIVQKALEQLKVSE